MRTIDFDFNFRYSRGGVFDEGNATTVCEPPYDKRNVYRRMQAYLGNVAKAMAVIQAEISSKRGATPRSKSRPRRASPSILPEGSVYEPRILQLVFQAVDAAWSDIAHHFGSDPKTIDKARMRLARAFLILCSEDSDAAEHHQE